MRFDRPVIRFSVAFAITFSLGLFAMYDAEQRRRGWTGICAALLESVLPSTAFVCEREAAR